MRWFPILLAHLIWLCGTQPNCAVAHPISHTDAWVKVSDVVDIRLKIFLDDVLRHQLGLPKDQVSVPAEKVRDAIARHGGTLLKQLQVFQDGQPLRATVVSSPDWAPYSADVDIQADASLKLTWDLRFEPIRPKIHSLCFVHEFTHPELTKAGELRLNLKAVASGRRISAVIPPRRPHTVVLPLDGVSAAATTLRANAAVSRLVLAPAVVVHEFTAPLLLLDSIWPGAAESRQASGINGSLSQPEVEQLQVRMADWFQEQTALVVNGTAVNADRRDVVFFVGGVRSKAGEQVEWDQRSPLPLFGTTVGIQSHHRNQELIATLSLSFQSNPGTFSDLNSSVLSSTNQVTTLVPFDSELVSRGLPAAEFDWKNSPDVHPAGGDPATELVPASSARKMVTLEFTRPGVKGITFGVLLFGGLTTIATIYWKNRRRYVFAVAVLASLICAFAVPDSHVAVDTSAASTVSQQLLRNVYHSVMLPDRNQAVNRLSSVLEEGLVESVYLSTLTSLAPSESGEVFVDISSVNVDALDVVSTNSEAEICVDCSWRVRGTVHHWGHSHERELILVADMVLVRVGQSWKIQSISPTAPVRFAEEATDA